MGPARGWNKWNGPILIASPSSYPCQSVGHWVSQWLIDSFRCDAIAYPSFANLFWHIESAQNCQNWGPIPPQSIQNLFRQNSCFLVGSKFLTSFEAPEFLGRIRTDLLPSADFLSFCSFPFGMQQTFEWFRKSLNLDESRRKLQPSFLLGFKDSRWVFWTTQEFSEGSEQQKYFLSNKRIFWGFSEQQKYFVSIGPHSLRFLKRKEVNALLPLALL